MGPPQNKFHPAQAGFEPGLRDSKIPRRVLLLRAQPSQLPPFFSLSRLRALIKYNSDPEIILRIIEIVAKTIEIGIPFDKNNHKIVSQVIKSL